MTKTVVPVNHADSILEEVGAREEKIRQRAFELFQAHADALSAELDDWLTAERQVSPQPDVLMREVDGKFEIEASLPGVERRNLEVKVTGEEVLITAKRESAVKGQADEKPASEVGASVSTQLFRAIHMPVPIDGDHVTAEFRKGLLKVTAPIARPEPPRSVQIHA